MANPAGSAALSEDLGERALAALDALGGDVVLAAMRRAGQWAVVTLGCSALADAVLVVATLAREIATTAAGI